MACLEGSMSGLLLQFYDPVETSRTKEIPGKTEQENGGRQTAKKVDVWKIGGPKTTWTSEDNLTESSARRNTRHDVAPEDRFGKRQAEMDEF
ncbi:hypothetical protein Pcinc_029658 [Petrolisthes cinctipes]|uniref:Uncharacterized protein n=1 Tax=Petrolisthes cinctipes TaxID=88211 RepID=A0AAE1K5E4_PETCI|nr:hypothetical protein Pcinc_029658 [Petrolisthes cinctipes]